MQSSRHMATHCHGSGATKQKTEVHYQHFIFHEANISAANSSDKERRQNAFTNDTLLISTGAGNNRAANKSLLSHTHTRTHTALHTHIHSCTHMLQLKKAIHPHKTRKNEARRAEKKRKKKKKKKSLQQCTGEWARYEFFNVPNTSWSAFVPAKTMSSGRE